MNRMIGGGRCGASRHHSGRAGEEIEMADQA